MHEKALKIYKDIYKHVIPIWVHYDQTMRAAGSIAANIAEGNGKDINNYNYRPVFLVHARGSLYETISWLKIAEIEGICNPQDIIDKLWGLSHDLEEAITKK